MEKIKCKNCGNPITKASEKRHLKSLVCRGLRAPRQTLEQKYEYIRRYRANPLNRSKRNKKQLDSYYVKKYNIMPTPDFNLKIERSPTILTFD